MRWVRSSADREDQGLPGRRHRRWFGEVPVHRRRAGLRRRHRLQERGCPRGAPRALPGPRGRVLRQCRRRDPRHRARRGSRGMPVSCICGSISQYNNDGPARGPSNYMALLVDRARMEGFVVFDYAKRYAEAAQEMAGWTRRWTAAIARARGQRDGALPGDAPHAVPRGELREVDSSALAARRPRPRHSRGNPSRAAWKRRATSLGETTPTRVPPS